jgi:hypothetical protein
MGYGSSSKEKKNKKASKKTKHSKAEKESEKKVYKRILKAKAKKGENVLIVLSYEEKITAVSAKCTEISEEELGLLARIVNAGNRAKAKGIKDFDAKIAFFDATLSEGELPFLVEGIEDLQPKTQKEFNSFRRLAYRLRVEGMKECLSIEKGGPYPIKFYEVGSNWRFEGELVQSAMIMKISMK